MSAPDETIRYLPSTIYHHNAPGPRVMAAPPPSETQQAARTERFDLRALYETSRLLSASLDLGFVLRNLLLTAMSKLLVPKAAALVCEDGGGCRVAVAKGRGGFAKDETVHVKERPGSDVLEGDSVPVPLKERGMALALPIAFGEREIGWLALGKKATGEAFAPAEMEFMRSLVNMSSAAVHNALLVDELQTANRDLDAKVQELNTLFDLSQEFNATVERQRLVKLLSFALMGQMLVQKHAFLLRRTGGSGEDAPPFRVVAQKGLAGPALTTDEIADLCSHNDLTRLGTLDAPTPGQQALIERGLALVVPIRHRGKACAMLCLGPKMTGAPYAAGDVEFLYALGNLAFTSIQNSFLVEEQIEKERMEEEMRLARDIQERLLPRQIPSAEGLEVAARATPSHAVGGDYFDVIALPGGRLYLVIADVTGKGVPAALLMANVQACVHALLSTDLPLEDVTARINEVICGNTGADKFITFFHGLYDPEKRSFDYVNAGHNPPYVVRTGGAVEELSTGGLLLGVMKGMSYERGSVHLEQGDVLALFTDGVTEAMSAAEEEYGEARLLECLQAHRAESAGALLEAIHADVFAFTQSPDLLSDDLTLMVAKAASE